VPPDALTASLRGEWGFDHYEGPAFKLADASAQAWALAAGETTDLIAGRADTLHLRAASVSCLDDITLVDAAAKPHKVEWKKTGPGEVEVTLALQDAQAGDLTLRLRQSGRQEAQALALHVFAQAGHLESFALHAGDSQGILRGNRLNEVRTLTFDGVQFTPGTLTTREGHDELSMLAPGAVDTRTLKAGDAQVTFADGRSFPVRASVDSPRPSATLVSKTVKRAAAANDNTIQLASETQLPLEARLTFSLRAESPASFTHDDKLEVATTDGSFSVVLGVAAGDVMLESRKIAVVTLDPAKALGPSAFGPLRFRRIVEGVAGEWVPLTTLVRLPKVTAVDCPADPDASCTLTGSNLFLFDSVSADPDFARATHVPDGFTKPVLLIPHPSRGRLYVKLRDDPAVVSVATLDVMAPPSASMEPTTPGPPALRSPAQSAAQSASASQSSTVQPPAAPAAAPAAGGSPAEVPVPPAAASAPPARSASAPSITASKGAPAQTQ